MSTKKNTQDNPGPSDGHETDDWQQADHGDLGPAEIPGQPRTGHSDPAPMDHGNLGPEDIPGQPRTGHSGPADPDHGNLGPEDHGQYPQPTEHQSSLGPQD